MTDNEIIKAFESLYKKLLDVRYDLKITAKEFQALNSVSALVNRQKQQLADERAISEIGAETISRQDAEIERLKGLLKEWKKAGYKYADSIDCIKSEAIKEFADKYEKAVLPLLTSATLDKKDGIYACLDILKEMVGDDNG